MKTIETITLSYYVATLESQTSKTNVYNLFSFSHSKDVGLIEFYKHERDSMFVAFDGCRLHSTDFSHILNIMNEIKANTPPQMP